MKTYVTVAIIFATAFCSSLTFAQPPAAKRVFDTKNLGVRKNCVPFKSNAGPFEGKNYCVQSTACERSEKQTPDKFVTVKYSSVCPAFEVSPGKYACPKEPGDACIKTANQVSESISNRLRTLLKNTEDQAAAAKRQSGTAQAGTTAAAPAGQPAQPAQPAQAAPANGTSR